ncbi:uncharacterized protein GIQ15_03100 [Arthroderma uncinatum]|uniref:uncharacterized protein n=1 Tax=Arthroderma uncinatum TaxID=74035 RepID=UPI00144AB3E4|nr:uncharacterized protein GIQ15_03100 [Arthroderma uncinatum]KAF3483776.1 hypothetical protein GIQ15_03100 [Arthroderma uncinatum]
MDAGNTGRLHKRDFIIKISTSVLFVVCWIAAIARAYIRIRIQRKVSWDDLFLAFGLCCLTIALAICYALTIDKMYFTLAVQFNETSEFTIPPDIIQISFDYQKWVQVTTVLLWIAIMAVKFSFLALFKNLVSGIRSLNIYWWVATMINIVILGYGSIVTHISCPYYYTLENTRCLTSSGQKRISAFLFIHLALDLLGDALILYIPVRLIWTVQVRWTQKLGLTLSLCLTILMSIVTIIRGAGVYYKGLVDTNWETYWVVICAEVGVCLAAATAFRSFFISRKEYKSVSPPTGFKYRWRYSRSARFKQPIGPREMPKQMELEASWTTKPQPTRITALPRLPSPGVSINSARAESPQSSVFILD